MAESLEILLKDSFIACSDTNTNEVTVADHTCVTSETALNKIINIPKIEWALDTFKPFKAAGMGCICPAFFQNDDRALQNKLLLLYKACLMIGHIP